MRPLDFVASQSRRVEINAGGCVDLYSRTTGRSALVELRGQRNDMSVSIECKILLCSIWVLVSTCGGINENVTCSIIPNSYPTPARRDATQHNSFVESDRVVSSGISDSDGVQVDV